MVDFCIYIMHINTYNYMHQETRLMRTTLNIEDELIKKAEKLTGEKKKTALVKLGLETLISLESSRRLAKLGGTEKNLKLPFRRKTKGI